MSIQSAVPNLVGLKLGDIKGVESKKVKALYLGTAAKFVAACGLPLGLSACASMSNTPLSANIQFPPAIDVPYQEVVEDIDEHVGVNVRWGGQIVKAEDVDEKTQLTVIGYPLKQNGKPDLRKRSNTKGKRFIVEVTDFKKNRNQPLITAYGPITGSETIKNGKKQKQIPIVAALETKAWSPDSNTIYYNVEFMNGLPYNGLDFRYGYFGNQYYPSYHSFYPNYYFRRGHRH